MKAKLLALLPLLVLSSCTPSTGSKEVVCDDSSMKGILTYLSEGKNFGFTRYINDNEVGSNTFTEKAISNIDLANDDNCIVYLSDDNGTYLLRNNNGKYSASEYVSTDKDLYNTSLVNTFYGKGNKFISTLSGDEISISITDKTYKMDIITAFGFNNADYVNINTFTATYENKQLTFELTFGNTSNKLKYTTTSLGNASIDEVDKHLAKGGKAYTPDKDLDTARRFMKGNNFVRHIYDINIKSYIGDELFNPRYFYTEMTGSTSNQVYLSLNFKGEEEGKPIDLCGIYTGTVTGNRKGGFSNISLYQTAYSEDPNILTFFHYPTFLKLWDYMDFMVSDSSINNSYYTSEGDVYSVNNYFLIEDFAKNFSIDQSHPLNTCIPYKLSMDVMVSTKNPELSTITFLYYFRLSGKEYCMPIPFEEFGAANVSLFDTVCDKYNNR